MCRGCSCHNPLDCCFSCCVGSDYEPNCYNCAWNSFFLCAPRCIGCCGCPTCLETREQAMKRRMGSGNNMTINQYGAPTSPQFSPTPQQYSPTPSRNGQTTTTTTTYYGPQTMAPPPPVIMSQPVYVNHPQQIIYPNPPPYIVHQ